MDEPTKYVCTVDDLDLLLDEDLKRKFQSLFYDFPNSDSTESELIESSESQLVDSSETNLPVPRSDAWRMFYGKQTPSEFLKQFGIDFEHPTVRDAVAFDLVKLDDPSVSNDSMYTYEEHVGYSPSEYERYLLHKNFRINLVNLDPDWSEITYKNESGEEVAPKKRRTVDKVFQGPRISKSLLEYFSRVMKNGGTKIVVDGQEQNMYVPFTNANDFSTEVALIPNTHPDFRQITSRSYYDAKWAQYKRTCAKCGFTRIATFALVDAKKDKNHTGEFLVKIQRQIGENEYKYLVVKVDKDGQIVSEPVVWTSSENTILCVCEDDYDPNRVVPQYNYDDLQDSDLWHPKETDEEGNPKGIRDIPMVHSTTSSHYSIFRQRVPDYDLKLVRHYLQFKNRLEGMELCLEQVKRDVHHKEVRSAECFSKLTMVLKRLMDEFASNKELMALVTRYYDLRAEWDKLTMKKIQIIDIQDGKRDLLRRLQNEYNEYNDLTKYPTIGHNLDKKLALGQKIASLKLELDKSIVESLKSIQERLDEIEREINEINEQILALQEEYKKDWKIPEDDANRIKNEVSDKKLDEIEGEMEQIVDEMHQEVDERPDSSEQTLVDMPPLESPISTEPQIYPTHESEATEPEEQGDSDVPALVALDTSRLHRLVVQSERWRNYSFNIGYELSQFKKMLTMCDDATIKVRRLVHNFEERMEDTQEQVWDENYQLKPGFDFKDISVAGLRDIILLHDWWAANAPGKTPEEMGMTEEEFELFRRRCNKVSYNLRKNQYAQLLAVRIDRAQRRISELDDAIKDRKTLHWDDRYGVDGQNDDGEETWTVEKANARARARIKLIAQAEDIIDDSAEGTRSTIPTPTRESLNRRRISSFVDVELEDENHSNVDVAPTRRQLAQRRLAKSVLDGEATARECHEIEKQYREDSKKLVERTVNYLKYLGLVETEADIERLALANASSRNPSASQKWLGEIQTQREQLDSSVELMRTQRESLQSIIDSVAKMETEIQELKQKNKRIFDICMKAGKKVKGVDKQVRNRMLMDKIDNEQKIFELKQLVKRARSRHLDDFSSLEKMRKEVDEQQSAYDQKVRDFKEDIGLTKEAIDSLMVGIYNKFQDEILEHDNKR